MNEIQLYNNKQIIGGFLLIIMLAILFASNILLNSGSGLNISYFIAPIVLTISILCIYYVIALNKSIKNTYDRYIRPTEYKYKNCPNNYTTQSTPNEIKCEYDADNSDIEHYDLIGSGYCNNGYLDRVNGGASDYHSSDKSLEECTELCNQKSDCKYMAYVDNNDNNNNNICSLYGSNAGNCENRVTSHPAAKKHLTYKKKVPNDKRTFFLEGRDAECDNEGSKAINGCFNHYDTTNTQCKEIFDYFDRNKYILSNDNWPEFKNMCILDPNPKVD